MQVRSVNENGLFTMNPYSLYLPIKNKCFSTTNWQICRVLMVLVKIRVNHSSLQFYPCEKASVPYLSADSFSSRFI